MAQQVLATLHTDGGSRGNPGPAGCGFELELLDSENISGGWFIGTATNNAAEYGALIWGMRNALAAGVTKLHVKADSKLVVEQMRGVYKVKNANIKPLFLDAMELVRQFEGGVTFEHVYRDKNVEADRLANEAMDAKGPVGSFLVTMDGEPVGAAPAPAAPAVEAPEIDADFELTACVDVHTHRTLAGFGPGSAARQPVRLKVGACVSRSGLGAYGEVYDADMLRGDLAQLLSPCEGADLNGQAILGGMNPTIEALAAGVLRALAPVVEGRCPEARLTSVTVWAGANIKACAQRR
jgi:ribonuclease HI